MKHGDTTARITRSIAEGSAGTTMAGWSERLRPDLVKGLALFVSERRQAFPTIKAFYKKEPTASRLVASQHHKFCLERVAKLASRPYAMAYLPGGRMLVSEKISGLSIVEPSGAQGAPLDGTPKVWDTLISV